MMASTMHSIENIYLEHKINGLKEYFIDPFEAFLEDDDIQKCINWCIKYKIPYIKINTDQSDYNLLENELM